MNLPNKPDLYEFCRKTFYGHDFVWYGVDKIGNIGFFETGELPIPVKVFNNEIEFKELNTFFQNLPAITKSVVSEKMKNLRTASGNIPDFSGFLTESNRGIFYFNEMDTFIDSEYIYGYYLIVRPLKCLSLNSLPEKIQHLMEAFRFPIIFSEVEKIDVVNYFTCD